MPNPRGYSFALMLGCVFSLVTPLAAQVQSPSPVPQPVTTVPTNGVSPANQQVGVTQASGQTPIERADEIRLYDVIVKDKPVGNISIRISQAQDGSTTTYTDTSIEASFLFIKYRYEFHDKETWQGDRLAQIDSRGNDNGTPFSVRAVVDSRGSRIDVEGKPSRTGPPLAMTENYWRLPSAAVGNSCIIEPDTGVLRTVRLQEVGADSFTVQGREIACDHFRLTGDAAADLWFDREGRLVRRQTIEQGYPTEQRLVRIHSVSKRQTGAQASLASHHD
jgi:hypothetical protein